MYMFINESGVELTVEEFREVVEHELVQELVDVIASLGGHVYISDGMDLSQMQTEIVDELARHIPSELADDSKHPSAADLKLIEIMRSLGLGGYE